MTLAEFCALPWQDEPIELVRGVLVRRALPYVKHGLVCASLCHALGQWKKAAGGGCAAALHGVITHRQPDSIRSIDVAYYSQRPHASETDGGYASVAPRAAFEVRSHDETWLDMMGKVNEFVGAGTAAMVVLDTAEKTAHVFRPDRPVRLLHADETLTLDGVLPGFSVPLVTLFE